MRKTMLTWDVLEHFEAEYNTKHYNEEQCRTIESAAFIANVNRNYNPEWTKTDIFTDFLRLLRLRKITTVHK